MHSTKNLFAYKVFLFPLVFLIEFQNWGQGCSDSGFCTIESFKPATDHLKDLKQSNQGLSFLSPVGQGDENVFVWTPAL